MAAKGYPGAGRRRAPRSAASPQAEAIDGVLVFHAGTRRDGGRLLADGGRVLDVTALGRTVARGAGAGLCGGRAIDWPEGFCRRDIGWRGQWNGKDADKPGQFVYTSASLIYIRAVRWLC